MVPYATAAQVLHSKKGHCMIRCLFLCVASAALVGCSDSPRGDKSAPKPGAGKESPGEKQGPRKNPLVGKWRAKSDNANWTENVSNEAVIQFRNDGQTMTITNNKGSQAEGNYVWQGGNFTFQARFTKPDGSKKSIGALVVVEKISDDAIVADYFTLQRIK
jgi:hypothetical protein